MKIDILSERKGSNPGGICNIYNGVNLSRVYFKYCYGSHCGDSPFNAHNQPIYEGITFQLARAVGLPTVDFAILGNRRKDLVFTNWREYSFKSDPSGREFYFVSFIPDGATLDNNDDALELVKKDAPYFEGVLISDIRGKRQNYLVFGEGGNKRVVYVDLGCNFVYATDGFIRPNRAMKPLNPKELKRHLSNLRKHTLITRNDNPLNLEDLANLPYSLSVPMINPRGSLAVRDALSRDELNLIHQYLAQRLHEQLPVFRENGLLLE